MGDSSSEDSLAHRCNEAIAAMYLFMDGELAAERFAAVKHHLDDCPPCGEAFSFESQLRIVVSNRCQDQLPEELRLRITSLLQQENPLGGGPQVI